MGWASAGLYFDEVAEALIAGGANDALKTTVCSALIGVFRAEDWDTHLDSLDRFADDPAIVAAFAEHEIYLRCGSEDPDGLYECTLDDGHESDHDDGRGNTWRDYPPGRLLEDARALANALFSRLRDFVGEDGDVFGDGLSWDAMPNWITSDNSGRYLWAYGAEDGR